MFDDIANPPKGKGKEKDVGKRRAYVRVVTTLGGGSLNLELFCEKVCNNYLTPALVRLNKCRLQKRATISSCSHGPENTMIVFSIVWSPDSWCV